MKPDYQFLVLEPDVYPCTFEIGEDEYGGQLELRARKYPVGLIWGIPAAVSGEYLWRKSNPSTLTGQLRTGHRFVLENVQLLRIAPDRVRVSARYCICGMGLEATGENEFPELQFQVGGLTELSGTTPIVISHRVRKEDSIRVDWVDDADHESRRGEDTVRLTFLTYWDRKPYSLRVRTFPVIRVSGPARSISDWMQQYVEPMRGISSLALSAEQDLGWLTVKHKAQVPGSEEAWESTAQVFSWGMSQQPYEAEKSESAPHTLIDVAGDAVNLAELISAWREKAEKFPTFFELFRSVQGEPSVRYRVALLALAPALESMDGVKNGHGKTTVEDHKAQRAKVIAELASDAARGDFPADDLKFVKDWLDRRGGHSLPTRLRRLYKSLDPELRRVIDPRIKPVPDELARLADESQGTWDVVASVRNSLAHGGESPDFIAVKAATHLCHTIAFALLLTELGVSTESLQRQIRDGQWLLL